MNKRVLIIDFAHQVYAHYHSRYQRMSTTVMVNGQPMVKDTTVQNGCIKSINRWSKGGFYPTAVCFDRQVPARKAYWQCAFPEMSVGSGREYKGNRESMPDAMYEAVSDCESILRQAGVSCFSKKNYEADDLIYACIKRAKEKYPGYPIDVVTNDADLLPLVDDTVSLFLRSKKATWAESSDIEKAHYVQVTPKNFQEVVEDLSAYKGFVIPYNTLLLHKLLRGDSSDNFKRKEISRMFPKTVYNAMIQKMDEDCVNFDDLFRYGDPVIEIYNTVTGEVFNGTLQEALASPEKGNLKKRLLNSEELDAILYMLKQYSSLSDEQLEIVKNVYIGMNLNQPYNNANKLLSRRAYRVGEDGIDIDTYDENNLRKALLPLDIHLKMYWS